MTTSAGFPLVLSSFCRTNLALEFLSCRALRLGFLWFFLLLVGRLRPWSFFLVGRLSARFPLDLFFFFVGRLRLYLGFFLVGRLRLDFLWFYLLLVGQLRPWNFFLVGHFGWVSFGSFFLFCRTTSALFGFFSCRTTSALDFLWIFLLLVGRIRLWNFFLVGHFGWVSFGSFFLFCRTTAALFGFLSCRMTSALDYLWIFLLFVGRLRLWVSFL